MGLDDTLDAAFLRVFGPQPLTTTCYLRDANDDGTDGPGVAVVLKELAEGENAALLAAVGALPTPEEKLGGWTRETLLRALVSFDGKALPADLEKRKALLDRWPHGVLLALKEHYELFLGEIEAAHAVVRDRPNPPGATVGPASAPKEPGATVSSAA
jgi:hypothetical protein